MARLKTASAFRFAVLALGTLAFAASQAERLGIPRSLSFSFAFNVCAYLGLRWPAIRSTFEDRALDDHLSWSGAFLGALMGILPALVSGPPDIRSSFVIGALVLMYAYYALGKCTCAFMRCCHFENLHLQRSIGIPLPLIEAFAATLLALTTLRISGTLQVAFALGSFGTLRILSRMLRSLRLRDIFRDALRIDSIPCLVAGILIAFRTVTSW